MQTHTQNIECAVLRQQTSDGFNDFNSTDEKSNENRTSSTSNSPTPYENVYKIYIYCERRGEQKRFALVIRNKTFYYFKKA